MSDDQMIAIPHRVPEFVPVDSPEGAKWLSLFARDGGFVLSQRHRHILEKNGVPTKGIIFAPDHI